MNSMTGYGRGEAIASGVRCIVECASVNRKGLEVACQIPRELAAREASIREAVAGRLARGRINVSITIGTTDGSPALDIDRELARTLLDRIRAVQKEFSLPGEVDINALLAIPGVIHAPEHTMAEFWPAVSSALDQALSALAEMREKEGRHLRRDIEKRVAQLRKARKSMQKLSAGVTTRYREQLRSRLEKTNLQLPIDDPRFATEIALFAERCDVSEELTRLESHFEQFLRKLDSNEPVGRALEFLTQEIYRELNTLGSKAGDSALTQLVVDSKVEVDRIREQVLNVE